MKKNFLHTCALFVMIAGAVALNEGCKSAAVVANDANGVVVSSVDTAMTKWAAYTQAGLATSNQIISVSNAYTIYYNSEIILSNAFTTVATSTNPSTTASIAGEIISTVSLSQSNIINLVNQFTGATK